MADVVQAAPLADHDPAFEAALRKKLELMPTVRALFIIKADGFISQDTDHPKTPHVSLADRDYFQAHQNDPALGVLASRPLRSRSINRWFVSVSRPWLDAKGGFRGVLVAAIEPAFFEKFFAEVGLGPEDGVTLFHADRMIIARYPEQADVIGKQAAGLKLFDQELPKAPSGVYLSASPLFGSEPRLVAYRSVAGFPLVLTVAVSRARLLQDWRRMAWAAAAAYLVLAFLVLAAVQLALDRHESQRRAQRAALESQKLEALGRMTGGVAHDFNNLLSVASGAIRLARRRGGEAHLASAEQALQKGAELTGQLLAFAKRRDLDLVVGNLDDQVRNLEPILRYAAGPQVQLTFDLGGQGRTSKFDPAQLDAALLNLVVNARDAMPEGGSIRISTNFMSPSHMILDVTNTGQGMPPKVLDRVFEPFFTTKGEAGTGLGLAQVYGFMRQIGGDARVTSEVGRGTRVRLLFPVQDGEAAPSA